MPIYTYKCPSCDYEKDFLQSLTTAAPVCERCVCMSCSKTIIEMERVFNSVGKPQFKGSGFYETDYKKKVKPG
jgi:putative FmdB family regulatory protein